VVAEMLARIKGLVTGYQERRAMWLRITFALAWAALIWWASSRPPGPKQPDDPIYSHVWNLGHVVVFGVLAALVMLSTQGCTVRSAVFSAAVSVLYGVVDEVHQDGVKGRVMDVWDVCSDGLGACIAVSALLWFVGGRRGAGQLLLVLVPLAGVSVHMASS
jgi:VanZ family protein